MKKTTLLLAGALLTITASIASAQGLNLAWNDCGGPNNKVFACNSNTATAHKLVGSYFAPVGLNQLSGNEVVLDLQSASATLPAWWNVRGTGQCRNGQLTANVGGSAGCPQDFWAGNGAGGIGAYNVGFGGANRARLVMAFAVPADFVGPVADGIENYAFTINIGNSKTVGSPACAGCADPVCLVLNSINLTQPVGVGNFKLTNPATSNFAAWQGGNVSGGCPGSVPTKNATWGSVKSLYR